MLKKYLPIVDKIIKEKWYEHVHAIRLSAQEKLSGTFFNPVLTPYFSAFKPEGTEPCTIQPTEPSEVTQIKKIVNALYYAELALRDVETDSIQLLPRIKHHLYVACSLLTHAELDLGEMFGEEFAILLPLLLRIYEGIQPYIQGAKTFLNQTSYTALSHAAGQKSGVMVDQLGLKGSDFEFLTQFSAVAPAYIEEMTEYFSKHLLMTDYTQQIDQKKLEALLFEGDALKYRLDRLQNGQLFLPLKALNFAYIIRHTLTLSINIIEQIVRLNDFSQRYIFEQFERLKYELLAGLLGFTDKLEAQMVLAPGTLSNPLLENIKKYYEILVYYASNWVEFSGKHQALLDLNDAFFMHARLEHALKRSAEEKVIVPNHTATHEFHIKIHESMKQFIIHHSDFKLFFYDPRIQSSILLKHDFLKEFDIEAYRYLDLETRPLTKEHAELEVNAEKYMRLLNVRDVEWNFDSLSLPQLKFLHRYHVQQQEKLMIASEAYKAFYEYLLTCIHCGSFSHLTEDMKTFLRKQYGLFQAHFVSGGWETNEEARYLLDQLIVEQLSPFELVFPKDRKHSKKREKLSIAFVISKNEQIVNYFEATKARSQECLRQLVSKIQHMHIDKPLSAESSNIVVVERADFVLKTEQASKMMAALRASLYEFIPVFNDSVRSKLHPKAMGIPFPEIEDNVLALSESGQILGIKRLFNWLYYIEDALKHLESLNNKSMELTYIRRMIAVGESVWAAYSLGKTLIETPYFSLFMGKVQEKAQGLYQILMHLHKHYVPSDTRADKIILSQERYASIFYILLGLTTVPKHIQSLRSGEELLLDDIHLEHQWANRTGIDIERIIARSDSYLKLFFEIPTMYRLFHNVKRKISDLAEVSHCVVMDNLKEIKEELFTKMLLEADKYEDDLGLIPGTISSGLKKNLDAYYLGLLEPLRLSSSVHMELVSSKTPSMKRLAAVQERIDDAQREIEYLNEQLKFLERLSIHIEHYKKRVASSFMDTKSLSISFAQALPILSAVMLPADVVLPDGDEQDVVLDGLLNPNKKYGENIANISQLTLAVRYCLEGRKASYQLTTEAALHKRQYVHQIQEVQNQEDARYLVEYTRSHFKKSCTAIIGTDVGFYHCSAEYCRYLSEYLNSFEETMVFEMMNKSDIELNMKNALLEKAQVFEQRMYQDYSRLENILAAIAELKTYLGKASQRLCRQKELFESGKTIAEKRAIAQDLERIAAGESDTLAQRIQKLTDYIQQRHIKVTLLRYKYEDHSRFAWLQRWVLLFCEWLGIYNTERRNRYDQLHTASQPISTKKTEEIRARYGLFAHKDISARAYAVPQTELLTPKV